MIAPKNQEGDRDPKSQESATWSDEARLEQTLPLLLSGGIPQPTPRQLTVACQLVHYKTYPQVAAALGVSRCAVRNAAKIIRNVTSIYNREDLVNAIVANLQEHPEAERLPENQP